MDNSAVPSREKKNVGKKTFRFQNDECKNWKPTSKYPSIIHENFNGQWLKKKKLGFGKNYTKTDDDKNEYKTIRWSG